VYIGQVQRNRTGHEKNEMEKELDKFLEQTFEWEKN